MKNNDRFVRSFKDVGLDDIPLVGGKAASLGEMAQKLGKDGIKIPDGFAVTAKAYDYFLESAGISSKIRDSLSSLDAENLLEKSREIRKLILRAEFPEELKTAIAVAYGDIRKKAGVDAYVAVRSSATAEDLPAASFAGMHDSYLYVKGEQEVLTACKKCFASLFTERAMAYREGKRIGHDVKMAVAVQQMVKSDKGCSGVAFSIDTESGLENVIVTEGTYGLGESLVQGKVDPDEYMVFKPMLKKGKTPIIQKRLGFKETKTIFVEGRGVVDVRADADDKNRFVLDDGEIIRLSKWVCAIEDAYSEHAGKFMPVDVEWAKDGMTSEIYIVQARPITTHAKEDVDVLKSYSLKERGDILVSGVAVGKKISVGVVNNITRLENAPSFKKGDILVTTMTSAGWVPLMNKASAIITDLGGRTSHPAIVSRELGIPCIVGTGNSTQILKSGQTVTVSCAEGERGKVYNGLLDFEVTEKKIDLPKTKTKVLMNINLSDASFNHSKLPNDGVGMLRGEFLIINNVGIHPLALINYENLKEDLGVMEGLSRKYSIEAIHDLRNLVSLIEEKMRGYPDPSEFYVEALSLAIGKIAAAFWPKEVILKLTDLKSNEYTTLPGGYLYEPEEKNPLIGWRSACRYYSKQYKPAFKLECEAIRRVREGMGFDNVHVLIPFCRTPEEGKIVIQTLNEFGLPQGKDGFKVFAEVEVPTNIILADDFAKIFDGFTIGSNCLTQSILGLDRDSPLTAHLFDERNPAVKKTIAQAIARMHANGKTIGIAGQAPSDFPDFAEFLVEEGIDSISLNPDPETFIRIRLTIAEKEKRLQNKRA